MKDPQIYILAMLIIKLYTCYNCYMGTKKKSVFDDIIPHNVTKAKLPSYISVTSKAEAHVQLGSEGYRRRRRPFTTTFIPFNGLVPLHAKPLVKARLRRTVSLQREEIRVFVFIVFMASVVSVPRLVSVTVLGLVSVPIPMLVSMPLPMLVWLVLLLVPVPVLASSITSANASVSQFYYQCQCQCQLVLLLVPVLGVQCSMMGLAGLSNAQKLSSSNPIVLRHCVRPYSSPAHRSVGDQNKGGKISLTSSE